MTTAQSCVLFASGDGSTVCIDIPRSIEEAQLLPSQLIASTPASPSTPIKRRIRSAAPVQTPFATPDPQRGNAPDARDPAAQLAELMALDTIERALETLKHEYSGPFCLPRLTTAAPVNSSSADVDVPEVASGNAISSSASAPHAPFPYYIPSHTRFISGRIEDTLDQFSAAAPSLVDLIVLDPPWANRSARRKRRRAGGYTTFSDLGDTRSLLSQIPVSSHLAPGGIVAVWLTNKHALVDLMTAPHTGVFAAWGVEVVAEWLWLKVTTDGQPVVDVASAWRKPWEKLLIAQRPQKNLAAQILPQKRVLVSVPDVHSRKPNLRSLFGDMLGTEFKGVEVFARNLTAGWCCWGDEVLKFQGHEHWDVLDQDSPDPGESVQEGSIDTSSSTTGGRTSRDDIIR